MRIRDLSEDDIGRYFWVKVSQVGLWMRVLFEGFAHSPSPDAFWCMLRVPPSTAGALLLRELGGTSVYTAVLVRAEAEAWLVEVDFAVSAAGEILEVGERAA